MALTAATYLRTARADFKRRTIAIEINAVDKDDETYIDAYVVTRNGLRVDLDSDACANDFTAWFNAHKDEIDRLSEVR